MAGEQRRSGESAATTERSPPLGPLHLTVNGEALDIQSRTLASLLDELGYGGRRVATARNGEFVPERARAETELATNDAIEVVSPRQGG